MSNSFPASSTVDAEQLPSPVVRVDRLSYFCTEIQLLAFFEEYVSVIHIIIMSCTHEGAAGLVTLKSENHAREVCRMLDGHLFQGRNIRVAIVRDDAPTIAQPSTLMSLSPQPPSEYPQISVAISSSFDTHTLIRPTETLLRKFFSKYGSVYDVQVTAYSTTSSVVCSGEEGQTEYRQDACALVTFLDTMTAKAATVSSIHHTQGLSLVCSSVF